MKESVTDKGRENNASEASLPPRNHQRGVLVRSADWTQSRGEGRWNSDGQRRRGERRGVDCSSDLARAEVTNSEGVVTRGRAVEHEREVVGACGEVGLGAGGRHASGRLKLSSDGQALVDVRGGGTGNGTRGADDVAIRIEQRELDVVGPDAAREHCKPLNRRWERDEEFREVDFGDDRGGVVAVGCVDWGSASGVEDTTGR